jgi:hypothetical protein
MKTICVWKWEDAPKYYRDIGSRGGDEDWVVYVPDEVELTWIPNWLASIDTCGEQEAYKVTGGRVFIGAHS